MDELMEDVGLGNWVLVQDFRIHMWFPLIWGIF